MDASVKGEILTQQCHGKKKKSKFKRSSKLSFLMDSLIYAQSKTTLKLLLSNRFDSFSVRAPMFELFINKPIRKE